MTGINESREWLRDKQRKAVFGASIEHRLATDLLSGTETTQQPNSFEGECIGILGGGLHNKGAQAMTFTVVDQLTRLFPEKSLYLFSTRDARLAEEERSQYTFEILPWTVGQRVQLMDSPLEDGYPMELPERTRQQVESVFDNCTFLVDISGYGISSQMGVKGSLLKLSNILAARTKSVPIYLLPQSIGPFEYGTPGSIVIEPLLRSCLSYPEWICARELQGVQSLTPYRTTNVRREFDLVLQYSEYELGNVFENQPEFHEPEFPSTTVGIVPNSQVAERMSDAAFDRLYENILEKLLENEYDVVVFRHSTEDLDLCRRIADLKTDDRIQLAPTEFNAIELESIIEQLEFIIGSRYHSIVHAYRKETPAVAFGWATKYEELLTEFNQSEYYIDCREKPNTKRAVQIVEKMTQNITENEDLIHTKRNSIISNDLVADLFGSIPSAAHRNSGDV